MNKSSKRNKSPSQKKSAQVSSRSRHCIWTPLIRPASAPPPRSKHAACRCKDAVYVYGGRGLLRTLNDLWRFSLKTKWWSNVKLSHETYKPPSLEGHTLVEHGGTLYVFGGEISFAHMNEVPLWRFDPKAEVLQWEKLKATGNKPSGRREHVAAVYEGKMYVHGGYVDLKGATKEMWSYDFEHNLWTLCEEAMQAPCPSARYKHSGAVFRDALYISGGLAESQGGNHMEMWSWNFLESAWSNIRLSGAPSHLVNHSSCVAGNDLFIFGGNRGQGKANKNLWKVSLAKYYWKDFQNWKLCRYNNKTNVNLPNDGCLVALSHNVRRPSKKMPRQKIQPELASNKVAVSSSSDSKNNKDRKLLTTDVDHTLQSALPAYCSDKSSISSCTVNKKQDESLLGDVESRLLNDFDCAFDSKENAPLINRRSAEEESVIIADASLPNGNEVLKALDNSLMSTGLTLHVETERNYDDYHHSVDDWCFSTDNFSDNMKLLPKRSGEEANLISFDDECVSVNGEGNNFEHYDSDEKQTLLSSTKATNKRKNKHNKKENKNKAAFKLTKQVGKRKKTLTHLFQAREASKPLSDQPIPLQSQSLNTLVPKEKLGAKSDFPQVTNTNDEESMDSTGDLKQTLQLNSAVLNDLDRLVDCSWDEDSDENSFIHQVSLLVIGKGISNKVTYGQYDSKKPGTHAWICDFN